MAVKKRNRGSKGVSDPIRDHPPSPAQNLNAIQQHGRKLNGATTAVAPPRIIDPQEVVRFIKTIGVDPSTQIVRHLGIFRLIIFLQLVHAYVTQLSHSAVDEYLVDPWMTYDLFQYFFDWAPKKSSPMASFLSLSILTCTVFFGMLAAMGGVNGISNSFQLTGTVFLFLYAFRFFMFAHAFTDRHYLLFLLGIITVVTGGGSFFLIFTEVEPQMTLEQQQSQRQKRQLLIQESEWGAVTLRLQFAVVYFYSSLWKLHSDYLQGYILRGHLIGFDDQQSVHSGGFWRFLETIFGTHLFPVMGVAGFLMDLGMFLLLTFRRPTIETSRSFVATCVLFHSVLALAVGGKLGYSFPITCVAGILIFYPLGGGSSVATEIESATSDHSAIKKRIRSRRLSVEANLPQWLYRYATGTTPEARATRPQQLFTIAWLLVQIAIPLRMPLISRGNYPFTGQCYRFSWTMMLHSRQTAIRHVGKYTTTLVPGAPIEEKLITLHLSYLLPEISGMTLQRRAYMPERADVSEDPRMLPIESIFLNRYKVFILNYPRFIARIAGGLSAVVLFNLKEKRQVAGLGSRHVSTFAVHFAKLNGRGAYCRVFDPTVDLALVEIERLNQPIWETWWSSAFDKPTTYEFFLASGVGSMNARIDTHKTAMELASLGASRVEYVADRAACLAHRPLALWPNGYPLAIMALEVPSNAAFLVTARNISQDASNLTITAGNQWDVLEPPMTAALKLKKAYSVKAISLEISTSLSEMRDCASTSSEDILFAFIFTS